MQIYVVISWVLILGISDYERFGIICFLHLQSKIKCMHPEVLTLLQSNLLNRVVDPYTSFLYPRISDQLPLRIKAELSQ
jgi:hypothetical protein